MIVRLTQWKPGDGVERDAALLAWKRHAALAERVPGLRRYVQHYASVAPDGGEPPYAGRGEAWFDDEATARAALASAEWRTVIDDAVGFTDTGSIIAAWSDRRLIREGA